MYLALAPAACAAPIFTAIGAFGSLPVEPTVCTCTCGRLHCVNTSSVRGTCTCHGVHRVAPAVYVTSAPVLESTRRLQHTRCTCACRGVHHVSTISVLRRASSTRSFRPRNWAKVTLLRSLVNSVSQQDTCLVDLGACIWHLSSCVSTGKMVVPTSQLKSNVLLLFGCMFCLVALSGQFPRILAHRLSLR